MTAVASSCWVITILVAILSSPAIASQADTTGGASPTHRKTEFSFTPRPLSECRHFLITEFSVVYRFDDAPESEGGWTTFLAELGLMRNVTPSSAVGGALFAGGAGDGQNGGVRGRYRLWLKSRGTMSRRSSLDFTSGVLLWGSHEYAAPYLSGPDDPDLGKIKRLNARYPGFATSMALNWREELGLMLHAEYLPLDQVSPPPLSDTAPHRTHDTAFYVGVRTGSYGGPLMWASVALSAVAMSILIGSMW
jgi:hypothetical protein